jgi:hypothetical protein
VKALCRFLCGLLYLDDSWETSVPGAELRGETEMSVITEGQIIKAYRLLLLEVKW